MTNHIIGMLHNTGEDKYHPIVFLHHPTPSGIDRYKSKVHHTQGFSERSKAIENAETQMAEWVRNNYGEPKFCLEKDFVWDGQGVPAMIMYFAEHDGKIVPI